MEFAENYASPSDGWIGEAISVQSIYGKKLDYIPARIGFTCKNISPVKSLRVYINIHREDGCREKYIVPVHYRNPLSYGNERWEAFQFPIYSFHPIHGKLIYISFSYIFSYDDRVFSSAFEYGFASVSDIGRGELEGGGKPLSRNVSPLCQSIHWSKIQDACERLNGKEIKFHINSLFTRGDYSSNQHPRHEIHRLLDLVVLSKQKSPNTRHFVHIAVTNPDNSDIVNHLIHAWKNRVEVECLAGWEEVSPLYSSVNISKLRRAGIPVYGVLRNTPHKPSELGSMHTKIFIFDGMTASSASFNLDFYKWPRNWENAIFFYSWEMTVIYEAIYQWIKGAPLNPLKFFLDYRYFVFYSFNQYLVSGVYPLKPNDVIVEEISRATRSILVAMFDLGRMRGNGSDVIEALIKAAKKGVVVRVLLNGWRVEDDGILREPIKSLLQGGVDVIRLYHQDDIHSPIHHKFAVFDSKTVITGSYNWYPVSMISDDEFCIVREEAVARAYEEEFNLLKSSFRIR